MAWYLWEKQIYVTLKKPSLSHLFLEVNLSAEYEPGFSSGPIGTFLGGKNFMLNSI